jgi:hypothetical protein
VRIVVYTPATIYRGGNHGNLLDAVREFVANGPIELWKSAVVQTSGSDFLGFLYDFCNDRMEIMILNAILRKERSIKPLDWRKEGF